MRLSAANLHLLSAGVERPGYDRAAQANGIVHFGIGAFHRAHQAWYTDRAMDAGDRDWAITGVSMRSASVADQLNPQDGLYTVTERSGCGDASRLIGAVRTVLVASRESAAVIDAIAAASTRIVSFTVTEKGYCRAADGSLDPEQAAAGSFYPLLAVSLRRRRDAGQPGLTLLSCDNLADNGRQLEALMEQYLERHDPALLDWFRAECTCPSTMVDRIVPATTDADRTELAALTGLDDHGAVFTEPFSQWVIEDRFAGPRPRWEAVGAQLVADVRPYETAKLRMLNGAHSLLAYAGLARGHAFVHQAIADPAIRPLVEALMQSEAAPTIAAAPGQDLARYGADLIARFANPALNHRLIQIAMDGSQKLPQRWLEVLAINQQHGRQCPSLLAGIAAWIVHLRGANGPVDDPRSAELTAAASGADPVGALFGESGLLASEWRPTPADRAAIAAHLA
ncbi:MAG: mannitol dehydrogenase family protein [Sphingomonadaceae bacterium]|nr:mannitol dehydrogenase family protein [Sphingomonadaceae bacterium]